MKHFALLLASVIIATAASPVLAGQTPDGNNSRGGLFIIGADISLNDIRAGRYLLEIMRRRDEVKARVHWLQTAGERLPFKDAAFDRVICTETLEHVDDESVLARELARVLKPGGILAVSVPDEFSEKIFWKLSTNYRTHAGGHVRIFRRPEIVKAYCSQALVLKGGRGRVFDDVALACDIYATL